MPGFVVPIKDGAIGGHGIKAQASTQYYYSYTWQIFQLVGASFNNTALVSLRDASLPTFTANQDSYISSSLEYKWAKSITWDDIKVSWYDSVGLNDIMRDWRSSVWTEQNGLQVADIYKKRSQIDTYTPAGYNTITWCLVGSWPKVIKQGELTYTSSDVKIVEVTITYDWAFESMQQDDWGNIEKVKSSCGGGEIYPSGSDSAHQPSKPKQ